VVFVTADIHETIVNDLSYREGPNTPDIPIASFEISTGAIGFEPGAVTILTYAHDEGLLSDDLYNAYLAMSLSEKDVFFAQFLEGLRTALPLLGYYPISPFGLEDSSLLDAKLIQGAWVFGHTLGWTEFDIDAVTQQLTVTTYGVDPLGVDPALPVIMSQFVVNPIPEPATFALAAVGVLVAAGSRYRRRQGP
jgi:alkaline phosphatase D